MEYQGIIKDFGILNRTFLRYVSNAISDRDISYSDSIFLVNIGEKEGTNQEEIANLLAIDTAAVARSVKSMEQKGYIRTERSQEDKRAKALYLTNSGRELYQFLLQLNQQWVDSVLKDLDSSEVKEFVHVVGRMSDRAKAFVR